MRPLNFAILKYFTRVEQATARDVMEALKPEYGSYRALSEKGVMDTLLTGAENGILEEAGHYLDENDELVLIFRASPNGVATINSYIKD